MKKQYLAFVSVLVGGTAMAVDINPAHIGSICSTWHFVNNQTGGAPAGSLTAWISGQECTTGPSSVLQNTQHFHCSIPGTLESASTTLPGRLVLSDCGPPIKPPPCDPKTDPECKDPDPK